MALLTYLTSTHFDFGAVQMLPKVLGRAGVKRALITTDKGVVAAGILDRVKEVLGDVVINGRLRRDAWQPDRGSRHCSA